MSSLGGCITKQLRSREIQINEIDPIRDLRWGRFVQKHANSSVFHSPAWLGTLQETYQFTPIAYVDALPGHEIENGSVFCRINSWVTRKRLVSLPFSDHAAPLCDNSWGSELLVALRNKAEQGDYRYIEFRPIEPLQSETAAFVQSSAFYLHTLPLTLDSPALFRNFHKDCIQRKIRRAERENLEYSEGSGEDQIQRFYELLLLTHKRHRNLPQSVRWFRNLAKNMGSAMKIRIASKDGKAIAGIITLGHKRTMTYKYGCSDPGYHRFGGMALLLWRSIQEAQSLGMVELDLGRSDPEQRGLITYKEHWNAQRRPLSYWRYPGNLTMTPGSGGFNVAKSLVALAPRFLLKSVGGLVYRHLG